MNKLQAIKEYARENKTPIMQDVGMAFLIDFIAERNYHQILELGTAIGYSAIQMALADDDNYVTTIERDLSLVAIAQRNIQDMKLDHRIRIVPKDAYDYEPDQQFDFIFIDAAKAQYQGLFEKYYPFLNPGGACFFDNMAFHGLVEHPEETQNKNTKQLVRKIKDFREFIRGNETIQSEYYEDVGDGILIVY